VAVPQAPFAALTDLANHGLPPSAYGNLKQSQIQAMLDARNSYAAGKCAARYSMPLLAPFDPMMVAAVCHLAAKDALDMRGADPAHLDYRSIETRFLAAVKYFDDVQRQYMHPLVNESPQPTNLGTPQFAAPLVVSQPLEGWIPNESRGGPCPPPSGIS
jgi:hypothetical protein